MPNAKATKIAAVHASLLTLPELVSDTIISAPHVTNSAVVMALKCLRFLGGFKALLCAALLDAVGADG